MIAHVALALACLALLGVIAAQDWMVPALRNSTISAGLTGPYHVLLDAAYVPLAVSLCFSFRGWSAAFAGLAAVMLILVAITNTAWRWFDLLTDGEHALWHSRFTVAVFAAALLLQLSADHGALWALTGLNVLIPALAYCYFHFERRSVDGVVIEASPAAEKLYVLGLCVWLIAVSL